MSVCNFEEWVKRSKAALKKVHLSANEVVQRRVKIVLNEAIRVSPQWSGNYAINWGIETNQTGSWSEQYSLKVDPWQDLEWWDIGVGGMEASRHTDFRMSKGMAKSAGDGTALAFARHTQNTYEKIATIKWNTNVRLVNKADVAEALDEGFIKLRKVNLIPGHIGVMSYIQHKYSSYLT